LGACDIRRKNNTLHKVKEVDNWCMKKYKKILIYFLEPIPENFGHSLGATPIGSAGRAPNDIYSWVPKQKRWTNNQKVLLLPSGATFLSI
jgi:hypothetical protein